MLLTMHPVQHDTPHHASCTYYLTLTRRLVLEGLANRDDLMSVYALMEGKVVNERAVWQRQGGGGDKEVAYCALIHYTGVAIRR
jgi:hypothetical protein